MGINRLSCIDTCKYCKYNSETGTLYFGDGDKWINNIQNNIDIAQQKYFVMCLFIIILIDSSMFTYCRSYYKYFREKTKYPKFGNTGFGFSLLPPNEILSQVESHNLIPINDITEDDISTLVKIFVNDCKCYFETNILNISVTKFIRKISTDKNMIRNEDGIILEMFVTNLQNYFKNDENECKENNN
jgi:hypothetical protein